MRLRTWALLLACLLLPPVMNELFQEMQRSRRESERISREQLYASLREEFKLPAEANVTNGFHRPGFMVGGRRQVTFTFPRTRTPAGWVSYLHLQGYGGAKPTRRSSLKIEGVSDYWRIEYLAPLEVYEMEWSTD